MRDLPDGLMENQYGSLSDGRIQFSAWYDGRIVIPDVPIVEWSQDFSGGQQVAGSTQITVEDETGELAPWGVDEPLGVGGAILQSRLVLDTVSVPLGWQRIVSSSSTEVWRLSPVGNLWISGGASISVEAQDMTAVVANSKFVSPEKALSANTVIPEIRRLLLGIMDVTFVSEEQFLDQPIPLTLTYRDERMDAVEDLIAALGASYRVSGTGQLVVYMPSKTSVWTVEPGEFAGSLINVSRSQSMTGLKNLIVTRNTLDGGVELQAAAEESSGPLRTTGPHGRFPEFVQADFATNQYDMTEAAHQALEASLRSRTMVIPLETIFHPGLEVGDWITVNCPVTTGQTVPLEGRVSSISYGGSRVPLTMAVELTCDLRSVQSVSYALRAQRWNS